MTNTEEIFVFIFHLISSKEDHSSDKNILYLSPDSRL